MIISARKLPGSDDQIEFYDENGFIVGTRQTRYDIVSLIVSGDTLTINMVGGKMDIYRIEGNHVWLVRAVN